MNLSSNLTNELISDSLVARHMKYDSECTVMITKMSHFFLRWSGSRDNRTSTVHNEYGNQINYVFGIKLVDNPPMLSSSTMRCAYNAVKFLQNVYTP